MEAENRRLALSLLASLLLHAGLLSLIFGGVPGFPGLSFPWHERRFEATDLRVMLEPPSAPAPRA